MARQRRRENQRKPRAKEWRKQRISFKYGDRWKNVKPRYIVRIGVCNGCRKVVPFDISKTNMAHIKYDINDLGNYVLELCMSCHRLMDLEYGVNRRDYITGRFVSPHT
jgi:hypothetical protein